VCHAIALDGDSRCSREAVENYVRSLPTHLPALVGGAALPVQGDIDDETVRRAIQMRWVEQRHKIVQPYGELLQLEQCGFKAVSDH
jgi:hypothetical protein